MQITLLSGWNWSQQVLNDTAVGKSCLCRYTMVLPKQHCQHTLSCIQGWCISNTAVLPAWVASAPWAPWFCRISPKLTIFFLPPHPLISLYTSQTLLRWASQNAFAVVIPVLQRGTQNCVHLSQTKTCSFTPLRHFRVVHVAAGGYWM